MQGQLKATIKLNDTTIRRIQDAIESQTKLLEKSEFWTLTRLAESRALENLTSGGSVQNLYEIQPTVINLTQELINR